MTTFEFSTASRIIFGPGKFQEVGNLAKSLGQRALIVSGISENLTNKLVDLLNLAGINTYLFYVPTEPTISLIEAGLVYAKNVDPDIVLGFGGGSAIDTGKAISALLTNPGEIMDYLEIIGAGNPLNQRPLPYIAVPTTAGTGAEVTCNAVLASYNKQVKVSLRSPLMLPRLAIIDPKLTLSLPPEITAQTGLDALTQCIEPFISNLTNPLTDSICREGIRLAAVSLKRVVQRGDDLTARTNMSLASLFGGLALANAKLGAVHGFAGPLGGMYPEAPHGGICGRLLPYVVKTNLDAILTRDTQNPVLGRFDQLAFLLTGNHNAKSAEGILWLLELVDDLNLPPLSSYGVHEGDFPEIVTKAQRASSMKGNPIKLTEDELLNILTSAI